MCRVSNEFFFLNSNQRSSDTGQTKTISEHILWCQSNSVEEEKTGCGVNQMVLNEI